MTQIYDADDDYQNNKTAEGQQTPAGTAEAEDGADSSKSVDRLEKPFELDDDVYAWSYLGSFDPNYISIQLYLADFKE